MDIDLTNVSDEAIREEFLRRKMAEEKPRTIIFNITNVEASPLKGLCVSYIDDLAIGRMTKDIEQDVFEEAMNMFYGHEVWDWINKRISEIEG